MCLNSCLYFLYLELSKLEEKSSKDISEIIPNIRQALLNVSSSNLLQYSSNSSFGKSHILKKATTYIMWLLLFN